MPAARSGEQISAVNGVMDLTIREMPFRVGARTGTAMPMGGGPWVLYAAHAPEALEQFLAKS